MQKQSKKFAVLNVENSRDVIVLPMNMAACDYLMKQSPCDENEDYGTEEPYKALNYFNTDYEGDSWKPLRRMSRARSRFASVVTGIWERTYYNSNQYIRMIDGDVKITNRFFDYLIHRTNVKYVDEIGGTYIIADDSMIPEGLTESYINAKKLVGKGNIEEIYGDTATMRYHASYHPEIEKQFTKFMDKSEGAVNFGFEAEKVDSNFTNKGIALQLAHETGFKKELDGSLGYDGFELISPILPLYNQDVINDSIKPVSDMLNALTNNSCGGHFNISKVGTSSKDILKKIKGSLPLLYMMYEKRLNNRYCEAKKISSYLRRPTKYSACYLKNSNILEIRLFPAIKNTRVLQNRIDTMRIIMSELYGLSAMKVLVKLADPSSQIHKHVLNILDGDKDKLAEKIIAFSRYAASYSCGKISDIAKKKVNKLMDRPIFYIAE